MTRGPWVHLLLPSLVAAHGVNALALATAPAADVLRIERYTIDGGGGLSSAGGYVLQGTIGQFDAGRLIGEDGQNTLVLRGGFWSDTCRDPACSPVVDALTISGEVWTDPTKNDAIVPPTVTLNGVGLVPTEVSLSTIYYKRTITNFDFDAPGSRLSFVLPPFPPGPVLEGAIDVVLTVTTANGSLTAPIRYNVLRRTVDQSTDGGDFRTLPAAILAAKPGWAIVIEPSVAPYVITGPVSLGALNSITLSGDSAHPNILLSDQTLDILQISGADKDRSVRIQALDLVGGKNAILITAGANPIVVDVFISASQRGIRVDNNSNAYIRDCQFADTSNLTIDGSAISVTAGATATILSSKMDSNTGARRGTVYLENTSSPALIANNILRLNSADDGGGLFIGSGAAARVFNNVIQNNTANFAAHGGRGGGIYVETQPLLPSPLIEIAHNLIAENEAAGDGECVPGTRSGGGGIFVNDAAPKIVDNVIRANKASVGGAMAICAGGSPLLQRNRILCNTARKFVNAQFYGGGRFCGKRSTDHTQQCVLSERYRESSTAP
jgi:hypothetical protein